ncbi:MAG: hypothetical protein HOV66_03035, partial [Streptomycetaceae bacterium]|nr:hypothetical protein [Streptomycetaceae bacterium]
MAPTLVASYYVQESPQGTAAITTPSFTPSNGEVLIVKLATWDTGTAMGAPTGGSQTYTSRVINAPGGFNQWCGIYSAVISGSPGSMTVSSTPAASARCSMVVERWSGAQLAATPVTNSNTGFSSAAASTITPTAGTSIISWVAGDVQSVDPSTRAYINSATDEGVRDDHVGSNGVDYYAYAASTGSTSQSYGLTAPTGMTWVIAAIEVQAAAAGAPAFPPNGEQRRRLLAAPRQIRGGGRISTPIRSQINPPFPFNGIKQPRQLRGKLARRGECWMPVPAQVVVAAPTWPPQPVRPRLRGLRLFRDRIAGPIPDQAGPPPGVRCRVRGLRQRARTETVTPVPAQVTFTPPAYPPQPVRTRLRGLRLFRGRAAAPVPAQVTVAPPAYVPQAVRPRLKWLRLFRARAAAPPVDQLLAPPAPRSRVHGMAPRRGHGAMPVPPQVAATPPAYPPRPSRPRLKGLRQSRGRAAA